MPRRPKRACRLSLAMIVRDSSRTLPAALESIRPWVDEMVVVDTGSVDDTPAIAARFGARVFEFPWCDDFSAARNASIRHARGQWLFWMDSDDTIDAENGRRLRALAYGAHRPDALGYVVKVRCPHACNSGADEATVVDHVKLFRNLPGLRFEFRIHEQLLPSISRLGGCVVATDLFVVHSGSDQSPKGRAKKCQRDLAILELELRERPGHSFTLFNFGMTYADMGDWEQAAGYLRRSLNAAREAETHLRKVYALLVQSLSELGDKRQAREVCAAGLTQFPTDPELLFRRALLDHDAGLLEDAEAAYLQVLAHEQATYFASVDSGLVAYKARHNLAVLYGDMHRAELAEREWRRLLAERPAYRPAWRGLGRLLVDQRRYATVETELEGMALEPSLAGEASLIRAALAEARGELATARQALEEACQALPDDPQPLESLCQLEFERGDAHRAERWLLEAVRRRGDDAAVYHNLGALFALAGSHRSAVHWFRQSLAVRPDWPPTSQQLLHSLAALGERDQVARVQRQGAAHGTGNGAPQANGRAAQPYRRAAPRLARQLNVALVTVAYNLPGSTRQLIESALEGCRHDVTFVVFQHSRFEEKVRELEELAQRDDVVLRAYGQNRGLARSWNEGILWALDQGHDVTIVANEDLLFSPGDLARLADAAHREQERFIVCGSCFHQRDRSWGSSEYGCFAYNRLAHETLGSFDENFFPVYCEDSDYRRRAQLAGLESGLCAATGMHHGGSCSLWQAQLARQNQFTYAANCEYYRRKWGGPAGAERYERPFEDEKFSLFIEPRNRHAPYPGFDRTDHDIVKF